MSSSGGDSSRRAALMKGLVLKDRNVVQIILQSVTQMVWLEFICLHSCPQTCNCSSEHESFEYMRNGQVIDMAMFEKIWKSIENGHCPHIQRKTNRNKQISTWDQLENFAHWHLVPRFSHQNSQCYAQLPQCYEREIEYEYLMNTTVSLLEVAAAVGNLNVLPHLLLLAGELYGENVNSWQIAASQKHTDVHVLQLLMSNDAPYGRTLRANVDNPYVRFIQSQLMYLVTEDCTEGLRMLLCICGKMECTCKPFLDKLVVSAVLYNNPEILNELSNYVTIDSNILVSDDFHVSTWQLATLLGYYGCASEIQKHSTENQQRIIELNHEALVNVIIWVLKIDARENCYVFHSHMAAETLKCLSMTASIPSDINVLQEIWEHILRRKDDVNVFSVMLEIIGCDVDMHISHHRPRLSVLYELLLYPNFIDMWFKSERQIVKIILKYNPSPDLYASDIINNAWKIDILIHRAPARYNDIETYQLMKALPTDEFALGALITDPRFNEMIFLVPVLFQHGFALDTSIVEATPRDHLLLRLLYQSIVSTPRSLMSRARIVLRQSYPGRRIHDFVNQTRLPVPIKEYILMTGELNRFCPS